MDWQSEYSFSVYNSGFVVIDKNINVMPKNAPRVLKIWKQFL